MEAQTATPTLAPRVVPALSIATIKAFERDPKTKALRAAALAARDAVPVVRAEVDAYYLPIFATYDFRSQHTGERITRLDDLYLSGQEALCAELFAALDVANREHGHDLPAGVCPALVAETEAMKAENALLFHASGFFGITFTCHSVRDEALALFLAPPVTK